MLPLSTDTIRRLRTPGYFVMTMLTTLPLIELCATAWPTQIHNAQWRFSIIGAAGATAITALLGLYFIYVIALTSGDRAVLWIVSSVCGLAAVICLGAAGLFPLDALQVKSQVAAAMMSRYAAASVVAMIKILAAAVVYAVLALSAYKAAGRRSETTQRGAAGSPLVVGTATARANNG